MFSLVVVPFFWEMGIKLYISPLGYAIQFTSFAGWERVPIYFLDDTLGTQENHRPGMKEKIMGVARPY